MLKRKVFAGNCVKIFTCGVQFKAFGLATLFRFETALVW
jgi:hypothetical protein